MWQHSMVNAAERTEVSSRRAQRVAYDVPARLRHGSQRLTVILRNLTLAGARIEGLARLRLGDIAMVQLPTLAPKAAKVVWTRGEAAGLEFERPLHPDIFAGVTDDHAEARGRIIADLEPEPDERPQIPERTIAKLLPRAA